MPFGTTILPGGGVLFRLWAPGAGKIDLCLADGENTFPELAMEKQEHGWFVLHHPEAAAGQHYRFRVDGNLAVPDPASRYQAGDVHGPSVILDPAAFTWQDTEWAGRPWEETVLYELHVGTFSPEGTYRGVIERLDHLVELGVTAIELMPLAQFPGRFNWGYDGTLLFAPCNSYGSPDELKELVQAAHLKGLMVFLDVVYNHFGPEGNYLYVYARDAFFTDRYHTPWGSAINFNGPRSRPVRDFYIANALYWLEEYHFDGLRFDAVHAIADESSPDILEEIAGRVHRGPGRDRQVHLVLENDDNASRYLRRTPEGDAPLYRAQWNDDIHHACHVLLTGEKEGYYADYADNPAGHLCRCLAEGFAYQGEKSRYRGGEQRGEPSAHLPPAAFVSFLQNHDQVGNRAFGERLISLCDREEYLLITALILLAPAPPLLFMGEEFGTETPFYFFSDFGPELAESVTEGRRREFARFSRFNDPEARERIPDPCALETFLRCKLPWEETGRRENLEILHHYRELLQCRRREILPRLGTLQEGRSACALHNGKCLEATWSGPDGTVIRAVINLDPEAAPLPAGLDGRILYALPPGMKIAETDGKLPPKSIVWLLKEKKN
jgi:malto-oligosyltrehalose trehalohydrolase